MKKVLIVGATGMVGTIILRHCLESDTVASVSVISRRSLQINHPKLKEIIHDDFSDYSGLAHCFQDIDIAHFCIGVYTGQVPDAEFKKITVDYAIAFADAVKLHSSNAVLCFLSGAGADLTEKSRISFARYKGMAENYLLKRDFSELYIFRPAYIYPVEKRKEPNVSYRIFRSLYPLMKRIYSSSVITSEELGLAMFKAGLEGAPKSILENVEIKSSLQS
ncbi:MAG: NAD-dependent epimerase/dehydratase family protein [Bacteroidota bacterium]